MPPQKIAVPKPNIGKIKAAADDAVKKVKQLSEKMANLLAAVDGARYAKTVFKLINFSRTTSKIALQTIPGLEENEKNLLLSIHDLVYEKIVTPDLISAVLKVLEGAKGVAISMFRQVAQKVDEQKENEEFADKLVTTLSSGVDAFTKIQEIKNIDMKTLKLKKGGGTKEEMDLDEKFYKKKAMKYKKKYIRLKNRLINEGKRV